jgi:D-alanyl-D-alanine carboxypeptidase
MLNREKLQNIIEKTVDNQLIFGVQLSVRNGEDLWDGSAGNLSGNKPFFIASTTKLFVTAIILNFRHKNRISLDDKIARYLPAETMNGLHIYKGKEYSGDITIRHLLSQTSGLPDYFEDREVNGISLLKHIITGHDQIWSFDQVIAISKTLKARFEPGAKGKAHYSDTNFQLLGKIIEKITGDKFEKVLEEIILKPLGFNSTYVYSNPDDTTPELIFHKKKQLKIPRAMSSFGPDGGIVSTSSELMTFICAFFDGRFFPVSYLPEMCKWNRVMSPLEYGTGIMRFKLPWFFSPFQPIPEFIGHSGLSGAFAYFVPEKKLFLTGTVNQIQKPGISYKMLIQILNS